MSSEEDWKSTCAGIIILFSWHGNRDTVGINPSLEKKSEAGLNSPPFPLDKILQKE